MSGDSLKEAAGQPVSALREVVQWLDYQASFVSNIGKPRTDNYYGLLAGILEAFATGEYGDATATLNALLHDRKSRDGGWEEAAQWHIARAVDCDAEEDRDLAEWHRSCARSFRKMPAKPPTVAGEPKIHGCTYPVCAANGAHVAPTVEARKQYCGCSGVFHDGAKLSDLIDGSATHDSTEADGSETAPICKLLPNGIGCVTEGANTLCAKTGRDWSTCPAALPQSAPALDLEGIEARHSALSVQVVLNASAREFLSTDIPTLILAYKTAIARCRELEVGWKPMIEAAKRRHCQWCAAGDPISLDDDGFNREGRYHAFAGGNRQCLAPELQVLMPSPRGKPKRTYDLRSLSASPQVPQTTEGE